jgi:glycerol-3-phosphate O-acyltransferase
MREQRRGDTIVIHVNSSTVVLPRIVAADAVRHALIQTEAETRYVFVDYSYFKIKALQHNLPITEMPKRISPSYQSPHCM